MNEDRENIKMLFNDILNIITDDYDIIFDSERMALSIVDAYEWDNEVLKINSIKGTIRIFWRGENCTFRDVGDASRYIHERIIINEFIIFLDDANVSKDKFHTIAEMLNNLED